MKKLGVLVLLIACLTLFSGVAAASDGGCGDGCEKSPGYWKNHDWPVASLEIGGITYTQAEAQANMNTPVQGDKTYTLFRALVAAKLNVLAHCTDCSEIKRCELAETIEAADAWMVAHPLGTDVRASSDAWQDCVDCEQDCGGEDLYEILDKYNNGMFDCVFEDSGLLT